MSDNNNTSTSANNNTYADGVVRGQFVNAFVARVGDLRYIPNGTAVLDVTIGVTTYAGAGKEPDKNYYRATFWGTLAERAQKALRPGSRMFFEYDQIGLDTYTNKEGETKSNIKLRASSFQLTGSAPRRNDEAEGESNASAAAVQAQAPTSAPTPASNPAASNEVDDDQDIPF